MIISSVPETFVQAVERVDCACPADGHRYGPDLRPQRAAVGARAGAAQLKARPALQSETAEEEGWARQNSNL